MGTWGFKQFEDDDAVDFTYEVEEKGAGVIKDALTLIAEFPEAEYLEAPESHRALAAAELIAAAHGNPSSDISEGMKAWIAKNGSQVKDLKDLAIVATERVLRKSELLDLWSEGDDLEEWKKTVHELLERLK